MKKLFLVNGFNTMDFVEKGEDIIAENETEAIAMFKEMHNEVNYILRCDYVGLV